MADLVDDLVAFALERCNGGREAAATVAWWAANPEAGPPSAELREDVAALTARALELAGGEDEAGRLLRRVDKRLRVKLEGGEGVNVAVFHPAPPATKPRSN